MQEPGEGLDEFTGGSNDSSENSSSSGGGEACRVPRIKLPGILLYSSKSRRAKEALFSHISLFPLLSSVVR